MSELDFPLSELRKLEEGRESFCSYMGLDTSPLRAPMNEIVLCCLLRLTSPETVPVRIEKVITTFKRLIWLSCKGAPYRNPEPVDKVNAI